MTVGELKSQLTTIPDHTVVVIEGSNVTYRRCAVEFRVAIDEGGRYLYEALATDTGKRVPVLIFL
jgi:hypothetical protein